MGQEKVCQRCGSTYRTSPGQMNTRKYCSQHCGVKAGADLKKQGVVMACGRCNLPIYVSLSKYKAIQQKQSQQVWCPDGCGRGGDRSIPLRIAQKYGWTPEA